MAKLIAKNTPGNVAKVRQRLDSETVTLKLRGQPEKSMTAGQALQLGNELLASHNEYQALQAASQLCELYPDIIDVWLLKLRALLELEELVEASKIVERLIKEAPGNTGVRSAAVRLHMLLGSTDKAKALLRIAVSGRTESMEPMFQMADCYRLTGEVDRATKILHKCLQITKRRKSRDQLAQKQYYSALLMLADNSSLEESEQQALRSMLSDETLGLDIRSSSAFALARQAERRKSLDEEVAFLQLANSLQAKAISNMLETQDFIDTNADNLRLQKAIFPAANPDWLAGYASPASHAPIFVMGMPRSGTTLMEQMLGSHTSIGQVGESKAASIGIVRAYGRHQPAYGLMDYPGRFDQIPHTMFDEMVRYMEEHQSLLSQKTIYIDKELSCFKYVGLLAHLFPKARFIHMNRPPMDIFLSCYKNSIPGIPATYSVEQLAHYYVYMKRLIGHWRKIFPDRVMVLDYTALVEDPEGKISEVLAYLGLKFEPQVLDFHNRRNVVRTLSVNQVRKGVYKTSIRKWLPYADMLAPALAILESHGISDEGIPLLAN